MTKVIHRNCKNCGRMISIFMTDDSIVLGCRCADCTEDFNNKMMEPVAA